ncbi:MAG: metallophosphoesterase, partial [Myxococcota bacterium]
MSKSELSMPVRYAALSLAVAFIAGCGVSAQNPTPADGGVPDSGSVARWPACSSSASEQKISFVHINDLHSSYNPDADGSSPASRLRGFYEKVHRENPYALFTNGGDDHEKGAVAEQWSRGVSTMEVVHAMKFDVRVLGNHDFAWGVDEVLDHSADPWGTVLASNTKYTGKDGVFGAVEYAQTQEGCVKIGVFGM